MSELKKQLMKQCFQLVTLVMIFIRGSEVLTWRAWWTTVVRTCQTFLVQEIWEGAGEFAFLRSSQVTMPGLLAWEAHWEPVLRTVNWHREDGGGDDWMPWWRFKTGSQRVGRNHESSCYVVGIGMGKEGKRETELRSNLWTTMARKEKGECCMYLNYRKMKISVFIMMSSCLN